VGAESARLDAEVNRFKTAGNAAPIADRERSV
jgi:hypothetical protein